MAGSDHGLGRRAMGLSFILFGSLSMVACTSVETAGPRMPCIRLSEPAIRLPDGFRRGEDSGLPPSVVVAETAGRLPATGLRGSSLLEVEEWLVGQLGVERSMLPRMMCSDDVYDHDDGDGPVLYRYLYPYHGEIPLIQAMGVIDARAGGVWARLPIVMSRPCLDAQRRIVDRGWVLRKINQIMGYPDGPPSQYEPALVYARPPDAARRDALGWEDETAGAIMRPTWMLEPGVYVDGWTGKLWVER